MSNSKQQGPQGNSESSNPANAAPSSQKPHRRRWLRTLGILSLAALVMGAVTIGSAEYYTSRPNFCGTCHIMDPYYKSWSNDLHGAKVDVWCVECHYAPGEQHTIKAKFKGLSQLASYFSGRYGAGRPRAHVDDASCMRSNCHGDGTHMDKVFQIGRPRTETRIVSGHPTEIQRSPTVRFVHGKHLEVDAKTEEVSAALTECVARLSRRMNPEALKEVQTAARSVKPSAVRLANLKQVVSRLGVPEATEDAIELMDLEHKMLRQKQLSSLSCSACHTYDATSKHHFSVDQQSCFVCHFTNQEFNRDTGECLKCHEPPTRKIAIHSAQPVAFARDGDTPAPAPILMDHLDIVNRGIDCVSCHADVISGDTAVTRRDCVHCHDQERYLEEFDRRTTAEVEMYHRVHIAGQRAKCFDCHRAIEHKFVDALHVGSSDEFLQPVINDCQHCHAGHHSEQAHMLMGVGGSGVEGAMPNAMFGSRINCRACHSQEGSDFKGDPLVRATEATCIACHGDDYKRLFDQWVSELESSVKEVEASLGRLDARIKEVQDAGQTVAQRVTDAALQARTNLNFVKAGNGMHNKNFAMQLLDISIRDIDSAMAELSPQ
ncbi:hypothetical protein B7486_25950 [cyanobacterium TDX16]|nr:hypothetical protein B7486_25950 [cyanobacterium TDX16]